MDTGAEQMDEEVLQEMIALTEAVKEHRLKAKQLVDNDVELDEESSYDFEENLGKIIDEKAWQYSGKFSEEETVSNGITASARALTDVDEQNPDVFRLPYTVYKRIYKNTFLEYDKSTGAKKIVTSEAFIPEEVKQKYFMTIPAAITPIPVE